MHVSISIPDLKKKSLPAGTVVLRPCLDARSGDVALVEGGDGVAFVDGTFGGGGVWLWNCGTE
jgi:hypothetical protein